MFNQQLVIFSIKKYTNKCNLIIIGEKVATFVFTFALATTGFLIGFIKGISQKFFNFILKFKIHIFSKDGN